MLVKLRRPLFSPLNLFSPVLQNRIDLWRLGFRFRFLLWKVLVPVPVPDQDLFSTTKSCPLNARSRIFSQKVGLLFFIFLPFYYIFYVGSGSGSGSGTRSGMHYGSGSAKAKKLRFLRFHNTIFLLTITCIRTVICLLQIAVKKYCFTPPTKIFQSSLRY